MNTGYYSNGELKRFKFCELGNNVLISKKASLYGTEKMKIGSNVRIDDFCLLVGTISLGNYIHIAAYTSLHASMGSIIMESFSTLSSHVTVYAASDDYSGKSMTNSVIPETFKDIQYGNVYIGKHVIVGTGSTLLHKAKLGDGVAIGAMSLVNNDLLPWGIYAGIPCKKIRDRENKVLYLEKEFLNTINVHNKKSGI